MNFGIIKYTHLELKKFDLSEKRAKLFIVKIEETNFFFSKNYLQSFKCAKKGYSLMRNILYILRRIWNYKKKMY